MVALPTSTVGSELPELRIQTTLIGQSDAPAGEISQLLRDADEQSLAGDNVGAIARYRQALDLIDRQSDPDLRLRAYALYSLGYAYSEIAAYDLALPELEASLALYQDFAADNNVDEPNDAEILVFLFVAIGKVYHEQSRFVTALTYYQQGLNGEESETQAVLLHNIGALQTEIGQFAEAEVALRSAVRLSEQIGYVEGEASAGFSLGLVYERQQNYPQAIASYLTAIDLFERTDEPGRRIRAYNNLSAVYLQQQDYAAAKAALDQGFDLLKAVDDPIERGVLLNSLGSFYQAVGKLDLAWEQSFRALQVSRQTGDKGGEIAVLQNLGDLMVAREQPELAIFFYKQAIAQIETIRQDLRQLSPSAQQQYTLTIEDLYRNLAGLLLQQGRTSEALQILDLLKLQEVKAYLHDGQADGVNRQDPLNTPAEEALVQMLGDLPAATSLADFLKLPAAIALSTAATTPGGESFELQSIEDLQAALAAQPVKTAAIYPLILSDRLEIILITPDGSLQNYTTRITSAELTQTVADLQRKLSTDVNDPQRAAQQLYDWLIRPLEGALADSQIENIIYLPDGVLRYVPIAALYDGQQWFAEKYQSHNITAAALGDLTEKNPLPLSVLAGAFTDDIAAYEIKIGQQTFTFAGLSAAKQEIQNLENTVPDTLTLLDQDFTPESMLNAVGNHRIVHLATHAKFVHGQPEESFILFGDGSTVNMRDIRQWRLPDVDLIVFSACQTGASVEGDGKEILGLGFQVHQMGAGAAIASLWSVNDVATAALMSEFYKALSTGQTKAQALQQAQLKLINNENYRHPYDWAGFILIGNGL